MMIKEVERNPQADIVSGTCQLVDRTVALCGPEGGVTGTEYLGAATSSLTREGQEAWNLIFRLRSRAWIKIGRDPHYLPTRTQVVQYAEAELDQFTKSTSAVVSSGSSGSIPYAECDVEVQELPSVSGVGTPNLNWEDWDALVSSLDP